uniref:Uncharacterized protein n=1 Tax=Lygus hesperus TaxID=30085 RepID=A0A146ME82_LYGHE
MKSRTENQQQSNTIPNLWYAVSYTTPIIPAIPCNTIDPAMGAYVPCIAIHGSKNIALKRKKNLENLSPRLGISRNIYPCLHIPFASLIPQLVRTCHDTTFNTLQYPDVTYSLEATLFVGISHIAIEYVTLIAPDFQSIILQSVQIPEHIKRDIVASSLAQVELHHVCQLYTDGATSIHPVVTTVTTNTQPDSEAPAIENSTVLTTLTEPTSPSKTKGNADTTPTHAITGNYNTYRP